MVKIAQSFLMLHLLYVTISYSWFSLVNIVQFLGYSFILVILGFTQLISLYCSVKLLGFTRLNSVNVSVSSESLCNPRFNNLVKLGLFLG